MPISEFSPGPVRKRIGFVRLAPSSPLRGLIRSRGYEPYMLTEAKMAKPGFLETTDAVFIFQRPNKPSEILKDLDLFSSVLNYDCRLYIRYRADADSQARVLDALSKRRLWARGFQNEENYRTSADWYDSALSTFEPMVHLIDEEKSWESVLNIIAANPASQSPNHGLSITLNEDGNSVSQEQELLLKRAFSDCSSVDLFPKTNGLSGVGAFEAFANLAANVVGGPAYYRCFVKLGPRLKVAREFQKYRMDVLDNVPFHLGPRLRAQRCALGASQGVITCDYVTEAETLRDSARGGRAGGAITSLFDKTLISWRRAARVEPRPLQEMLDEFLSERTEVPAHREEAVANAGATMPFNDLKDLILASGSSSPVMVGVAHCDLHATNVLVRKGDAVIIDLERVRASQPLLIDAASLESGLFVDGFVGDERSVTCILESLKAFYTKRAFEYDDHYCDSPSDASAWYVDGVREIRMQARQMELQPHQYAWTLAAVFLKKACNAEDFSRREDPCHKGRTREEVRSAAYALAENIARELSV
jgi:hypothetical protein